MPTPTVTDPLATFMAAKLGDRRPIPLVATAVDVEIRRGIAVVSTRRTFRNAESGSIEAVLTFPVPVLATLFALEVRIDERLLIAKAQRRTEARATYETAIDDGLTAVLHEEVLRGVHMLSVGQLAPGVEVEVTTRWVATLAYIGARGQIRIPMTAGEIYGTSPLPESDDFFIGGDAGQADLIVRSDGPVELIGGKLVDGRGQVPLNAPIDLVVPQAYPGALRGVSADGREIQLLITPLAHPDGALQAALLIDRSGSMAEQASGSFGNTSKHQLAVAALASVAPNLAEADELDLWEFDTELAHIGSVRPDDVEADHRLIRERYRGLVARLGEPRGGTEIGRAIEDTLRETLAHDLLLITDGKSHAIDVQALAAMGRRISVLLVGEDSLEANVGHLAALTGGELFVAMEADMTGALAGALASLRAASRPLEGDSSRGLRAVRRGARLEVSYGGLRQTLEVDVIARAVAALVADLRLATLGEEAASDLAEKEGLVTHLTSLVLVDHAGTVVDGQPEMRKIALPNPRTGTEIPTGPAGLTSGRASLTPREERVLRMRFSVGTDAGSLPNEDQMSVTRPRIHVGEAKALRTLLYSTRSRKLRSFLDSDAWQRPDTAAATPGQTPDHELTSASPGWEGLEAAFAGFDWTTATSSLVAGDLSGIASGLAKTLLREAARDEMVTVAAHLGLDPLLLVIGRLATRAAGESRSAARVTRAIFRGLDPEAVQQALQDLEHVSSAGE